MGPSGRIGPQEGQLSSQTPALPHAQPRTHAFLQLCIMRSCSPTTALQLASSLVHLSCWVASSLVTVTRALEVLFPARESAEQRYSALSRSASRSQLSTRARPSGSAWVCVGTHTSSSRPFFSQRK